MEGPIAPPFAARLPGHLETPASLFPPDMNKDRICVFTPFIALPAPPAPKHQGLSGEWLAVVEFIIPIAQTDFRILYFMIKYSQTVERKSKGSLSPFSPTLFPSLPQPPHVATPASSSAFLSGPSHSQPHSMPIPLDGYFDLDTF